MTKRFIKNTMLIVVVVVLLCVVSMLVVVYGYYNDKFTEQMYDDAVYLSSGVELSGDKYLENMSDVKMRITWISDDGTVLYDNRADISSMDNHGDRQEVKEAMLSSKGKSVRYSNTLSEKTVYYAVRISDGSVLRIAYTQNSIFVLVMKMMQPVLIVVIIAFALSGFLAFRLSKQIMEPLEKIDLENPEETEVYEEMSPFLRKIAVQNEQIKNNIEELKKQKREFDIITENMQEGLIVIDKTAKIISHNSATLSLFSVSFDIAEKNILMLNRAEEFAACVESVLAGRHCERVIGVGERYYNIYFNPVINSDEVIGAIIVVTDVTEKEERENLRREFSANVSHELKTPLTSISGIAEIIKTGIVASEDIPEFAGKIYDEAKRLISLIEDIIKVSQLDEDDEALQTEEFDLYALSQEIIESLEPVAKEKGITVSLEGENTYIRGIKTVIEEMVYNLCDNAIKYNVENGKVVVSTVKAKNENVLSVKDTGIGVAKEHQERIFERFYRVDKSHSKEIGGTGLGLSIVKHGAKLHNAKINIESEPGIGTKISLIF